MAERTTRIRSRHSFGVMRVRAVLVIALTEAERRGLVARNAAKPRLAEMPAGARPAHEGRSLTEDQARQLLRRALVKSR